MTAHHRLPWKTLAVPVAVGLALIAIVWWAGPGILGDSPAKAGTLADATVVTGAPCSDPNARETVHFDFGGQQRTGSLDACGNGPNDRVQITVPSGIGAGTVDVHFADVVQGHNGLRRPVGLVLLVLSCAAGAMYAFLVQRGPRKPETAVVTV